MKLTPLDLRKQQFKKAFRGYDPDEVHGFIEKLAQDWEEVLEEKRRAEERVEQYEDKLGHYEKVELALQEALEAARETGRRAEDAAHQRARLIVEEAELRAQRIVQDAEQERYNVRQDLVKLSSRQNEIAARLRAFLMSEMEVLAQFQGDDPIGFIKLVAATERGSQEALPGGRARLGPAPEKSAPEEVAGAAPESAPLPHQAAEAVHTPEAEESRGATAPHEPAEPASPPISEVPREPEQTSPASEASSPGVEAAPPVAEQAPPDEAVPPPPAPSTPAPAESVAAEPESAAPEPERAPVEPEAPVAAPAPAPASPAAGTPAPSEPTEESSAPPPPWVHDDTEADQSVPTYRDWLSVLSARRAEAQSSRERGGALEETADQAEDAAEVPFDRTFFRPPAPEAPPEPAPTSDAARGWSLRSIVTGDREERAESITATQDERERIRRILEDLD